LGIGELAQSPIPKKPNTITKNQKNKNKINLKLI